MITFGITLYNLDETNKQKVVDFLNNNKYVFEDYDEAIQIMSSLEEYQIKEIIDKFGIHSLSKTEETKFFMFMTLKHEQTYILKLFFDYKYDTTNYNLFYFDESNILRRKKCGLIIGTDSFENNIESFIDEILNLGTTAFIHEISEKAFNNLW